MDILREGCGYLCYCEMNGLWMYREGRLVAGIELLRYCM